MSGKERLEKWCDTACAFIRFKPDRAGVKQELMWHLEDKWGVMIESGMDYEAAARKAVSDMGAPEETGKLLRKIHKPYLGWLWVASQWLLALAIIAVALTLPGLQGRLGLYKNESPLNEVYVSEKTEYGTRTFYSEPKSSAKSDGYTFTITRVAQWHYDGTYEERTPVRDGFYFTLRATSLLPWAGPPYGVMSFHAVDNNGNRYRGGGRATDPNGRYVVGNILSQGFFSYTFDMWLENYSTGADRLEIRYERSGRSLVLPIVLQGGEPR